MKEQILISAISRPRSKMAISSKQFSIIKKYASLIEEETGLKIAITGFYVFGSGKKTTTD